MNTALVIPANPAWTDELSKLAPGSHMAVFGDDVDVGIEGRMAGLELRDTILVLRPVAEASRPGAVS